MPVVANCFDIVSWKVSLEWDLVESGWWVRAPAAKPDEPELHSWDSHGGGREPLTPHSCLGTCVPHTQITTHNKIILTIIPSYLCGSTLDFRFFFSCSYPPTNFTFRLLWLLRFIFTVILTILESFRISVSVYTKPYVVRN